MLVRTSCNHDYPKPWTVGFLRYSPFFFCEVCGNAEGISPDYTLNDEVLDSTDAMDLAERFGWGAIPNNLRKALEEGGKV